MNKQQMQVKEEIVKHKLTIYVFLQKFYAGHLNHVTNETWKGLIELISHEINFFSNEKIKKGSQLLSHLTDEDLAELEFDFNRLFVGPTRLQASPYESTYRNIDRALMQVETLAVRRFYEKAGLIVSNKNVDPDDHLALELEFVCYLLENSIENEMYDQLYQAFVQEHLFQWIEKHAGLVREHTENSILIAVSYLLEGLLMEEKANMIYEGGNLL
ncbi:molecular chaperone TorD family protein [Robertmurraya massiliosenegalensis]|uniref:TorD/DmsD family molecular chaperone n=1 Tax=Robertmurraya TaxID=2837507 RepID=UPI0039A45586